MSITNYNPSCNYKVEKLDNVIYIVQKEIPKDIKIDNGEAYIEDISQRFIYASLRVDSIQVEENEELDERYKFTHSITFSLKGYHNTSIFGGNYFIIFKGNDGAYWMVNPIMDGKVTYTYTLDANNEKTDFTLATVSNYPMLKVVGFDDAAMSVAKPCEYKHSTIGELELNVSKYSIVEGNNVICSNDGFKSVDYLKNSATFTETYDGTYIQHQLDFKIGFDAYKSSWHYNLLEFTDNKYCAVIKTSRGKYVLSGFGYGLQPSYTVNADSSMSVDTITITLSDKSDNSTFITYKDSVRISRNTRTTWQYTTKYNGYECIGGNTAQYLLKEEIDIFGNPTGYYKCLYGYESRFTNQGLDIIDTFSTTETFTNYDCSLGCTMQNSFPSQIVFNTVGTKTFELYSTSDWSLSSTTSNIRISPSSGAANTPYTITVENSRTPTSVAYNSDLRLTYCDGNVSTYDVVVEQGYTCLPQGRYYYIDATGQYVIIPISCPVQSVVDYSGLINDKTIQTTYVKIYIPTNTTTSTKYYDFAFRFFNDDEIEVFVTQSRSYYNWVSEYEFCDGGYKCEFQRLYTGITASEITAHTQDTRVANCQASSDCEIKYRWIDDFPYCNNGNEIMQQKRQYSLDGGTTWDDVTPKEYQDVLVGENVDYCSTCNVISNIPSTIYFDSANQGLSFNFMSETDWSVVSTNPSLLDCGYWSGGTFMTSGSGGTPYEIYVMSYLDPSPSGASMVYDEAITFTTCGKQLVYNVHVAEDSGCLPSKADCIIQSSGGSKTLYFSSSCERPSSAVEVDGKLTNITTSSRSRRITINNIPINTTNDIITYHLLITFADNTQQTLELTQLRPYYKWEYFGIGYLPDENCAIDYMYTGTSISDISSWDETHKSSTYRFRDCQRENN